MFGIASNFNKVGTIDIRESPGVFGKKFAKCAEQKSGHTRLKIREFEFSGEQPVRSQLLRKKIKKLPNPNTHFRMGLLVFSSLSRVSAEL